MAKKTKPMFAILCCDGGCIGPFPTRAQAVAYAEKIGELYGVED